MKKLPAIIAIVLSLTLGFIGGRYGSVKHPPLVSDTIVHRDTVVDTVEYRQPVPIDSIVLRYVPIKLPVADTVRADSVYVEVPIQQKEYKDSTYRAWVSGFNAKLDSIQIYQRTITVTQHIRAPYRRWGLGLQVGAGYSGTDKKISPYIGIGISYNILTW